jgi:hypothetical protein
MQHVQVRVCERGALRNGRFAFTDRYTLVSELLQNARRAGATHVRIEHDAERRMLAVIDDGRGIDDFQQLLTFNESGWDAATVDEEHAFGVGFSKALYAARFVSVASRGRRLAFRTDDALTQRPLDVADDAADDPSLTVVRLEGVDIPELGARIARMVCGFALPVSFNGNALPRPYASDALPCTETPIGRVHLHGFHSGQRSLGLLLFVQGLAVNAPTYWCDERCDVVHLDARQFLARLPDRSQLIDSDEQLRRIDAAIRSLWRSVLERRRAQLGDAVFIDSFFDLACSQGAQDLFDDIALLPRQLCEQIVGYPVQAAGDPRSCLRMPPRHFTRNEVERGEVRLARLEEPNDDNIAHWMFARASRLVLVRWYRLDAGHWAQAHIRDLEQEAVTLTIDGEAQRVEFEGRGIWPTLVLCAGYGLSIGGECVEITDEAIFHADQVIVPAGEASGRVVRQASPYRDDEDRPLDDDMAADECELAQLIRLLRADDPAQALAALLGELSLENYPLLTGRSFRLTVGLSRSAHSVVLADR